MKLRELESLVVEVLHDRGQETWSITNQYRIVIDRSLRARGLLGTATLKKYDDDSHYWLIRLGDIHHGGKSRRQWLHVLAHELCHACSRISWSADDVPWEQRPQEIEADEAADEVLRRLEKDIWDSTDNEWIALDLATRLWERRLRGQWWKAL